MNLPRFVYFFTIIVSNPIDVFCCPSSDHAYNDTVISESPSSSSISSSPRIALIAAVAQNKVIGCCGKLPWRLQADLARFRAITLGSAVIMGRRTFEAIGHPLDGRLNIVLSRNPKFEAHGCVTVRCVSDAIAATETHKRAFVIGGAEVYASFLPLCKDIYLTTVIAEPEGDTFFPAFDESQWIELERISTPVDPHNDFAAVFKRLTKRI